MGVGVACWLVLVSLGVAAFSLFCFLSAGDGTCGGLPVCRLSFCFCFPSDRARGQETAVDPLFFLLLSAGGKMGV